MAVIWDSRLPQCPLRNGFSVTTLDNAVRSPTQTGPGKIRRKQSHANKVVNLKVLLDKNQRNILSDMYEDFLGYRFAWAELDEAVDAYHHSYQFANAPKYTPFGCNSWIGQLQLQVWQPDASLAIYYTIYEATRNTIVAEQATFFADLTEQVYVL